MSLFNAMKALKYLGNMDGYKEVIIETPLTTTIEGPANGVKDVPQPHGIPMSMMLHVSRTASLQYSHLVTESLLFRMRISEISLQTGDLEPELWLRKIHSC